MLYRKEAQCYPLQKNDYGCHTFKKARAAKIIWVGHPGDSPLDVRARQFVAQLDENSGISPEKMKRAIRDGRAILRWTLRCAGIHDMVPCPSHETPASGDGSMHPPVNEEADGAEEEEEEEEEPLGAGDEQMEERNEDDEEDERGGVEDHSESGPHPEVRKRWKRCSHQVKLRVSLCFMSV